MFYFVALATKVVAELQEGRGRITTLVVVG